MAWDERLFDLLDDLEGQAEALYAAERDVELADRSRAAYATVTLAGRLMASVGRDVALEVAGAGRVAGTLQRTGAGWCLVRAGRDDWLVLLDAVTTVEGASERSMPEVAWSPVARLGPGSALRRLADQAAPCLVHTHGGGRHAVVLARVGLDFVEATDGADGGPDGGPDGGAVRRWLFALSAVSAVRSRDG